MGSPKQIQIPTIEQLKNMPLMDMVNKESMRIMTTLSAVRRETSSTYTLSNGIVIPKSTPVLVHLWGVHHNPSAFPNPFEFNPSRFKDISSEESKNFQAFTLGTRICKYYIIIIY
jgi:cytochrome P450